MKNIIQRIADELNTRHNADLYFVGGCVRDAAMEILSQGGDASHIEIDIMNPEADIDIAVSGCSIEQLVAVVEPFAERITKEAVGSDFAVVKATIEGIEFDFALCRGESSTGNGSKDFAVTFGVSINDDLLRRDLTVNAVAVHVTTGILTDPFGGLEDMKAGIAREVSPFFAEDPLRVVRAARFCARFNLTPSESLIDLCRSLSPSDLSAERFGMELKKAMVQAQTPSIFFEFLDQVGWLSQVFPELHNLKGVEQNPIHHPEGDAFVHTMHCIDAANDSFTRLVMMCHDLGKATTTCLNKKGSWCAHGHERAGVPLADAMLSRVKLEGAVGGRKVVDQILLLTELHMLQSTPNVSDKSLLKKVRSLHKANLTFADLAKVMRADSDGRPPKPRGIHPEVEALEARVQEFHNNGLFTPVVTGRMLLEAGLKPSPKFGARLQQAQALQDKGLLNKDNWRETLGL